MSSTEPVTKSKEEFEALKSENAELKHRLADLKRLIYGAKSERHVAPNPDQATLFDLHEVKPGKIHRRDHLYPHQASV